CYKSFGFSPLSTLATKVGGGGKEPWPPEKNLYCKKFQPHLIMPIIPNSRNTRSTLKAVSLLVFTLGCSLSLQSNAQDTLRFAEFRDPGKSWSHAGNVAIGPDGNSLIADKGEGVLVNIPSEKNPGKDLYSKAEYG